MNSGERKIAKSTAAMMVGVALFFDLIEILLNFIPGPGWILIWLLDVLIWLTFYVWFMAKGVNFAKSNRAVQLTAGMIIEMIPILDILPGWTIAIFLIIRSSWKEDRLAAQTVEENA